MTAALDAIRVLAAAATPGPWRACPHLTEAGDAECSCGYRGEVSSVTTDELLFEMGAGPVDDHGKPDAYTEGEMWRAIKVPDRATTRANGRYLAAVDPQTVLALLAALDRAEAVVVAARAWLGVWGGPTTAAYQNWESDLYRADESLRVALAAYDGADEPKEERT